MQEHARTALKNPYLLMRRLNCVQPMEEHLRELTCWNELSTGAKKKERKISSPQLYFVEEAGGFKIA